MQRLFPQTQQAISDFFLAPAFGNNNLTHFEILDELHSKLLYIRLSEWDPDQYLGHLNDILSGEIEEELKKFIDSTLNVINGFFPIPCKSLYDFCGTMVVLKSFIDNPAVIDSNVSIGEFIEVSLNKLETKVFAIMTDWDEDDYETRELVYYPTNFPYHLLMNDHFMNHFLKKWEDVTSELRILHLLKPHLNINESCFHLRENPLCEKFFNRILIKNALHNQERISLIPRELMADEAFIREMLLKIPCLFRILNDQQRDNLDLALLAIQKMPESIAYASERLRDDENLMREVVSKNGDMIGYASERLRANTELALIAIQNEPAAIRFLSEALQSDSAILLKCLQAEPDCIQYLSLNIRREVIGRSDDLIKLILSNSDELKTLCSLDPDIFDLNDEYCELALLNYEDSLKFMPARIKADPMMVLKAIKKDVTNLQYASEALRNDHGFMSSAISENPLSFYYCIGNIKSDLAICREAVLKYPAIYSLLPEEIKNNEEFVSLLCENLNHEYEMLAQWGSITQMKIKELTHGEHKEKWVGWPVHNVDYYIRSLYDNSFCNPDRELPF